MRTHVPGWVKITNPTLITGVIQAKLLPPINRQYFMWVPAWVRDAGRLWEQNQGQYAGLTLSEFLIQMRPVDGHRQSSSDHPVQKP